MVEHLQGAIPAINLSAQAALCTAIANDNGAQYVFAQQVIGYGRPGDILLGISTSGNSENVINAAIVARALGLKTIGLTGRDGGRMNQHFDILIKIPEDTTERIQEEHMKVYHFLCGELERWKFGQEI